jgi:hypothetical protein
MSHIFTYAKFADMLYVYDFCEGSAIAAVEEYSVRFLTSRIVDRRVFSNLLNTRTLSECGTLPSAHVPPERTRQ